MYIWEVSKNLNKGAIPLNKSKIVEIFDEAKLLLARLRKIISKKEYAYILETIETGAIPTPKLLIKDHKKYNKEGNFPTRLAVIATNSSIS